MEKYGSRCFIYLEPMDEKLLQVDHRIPYEIGGEQNESDMEGYMLLSLSANRAKSWACEHCENWNRKDISFCVTCFWAHPENYEHIAGKKQRMIPIVFTGGDIEDYNSLISKGGIEGAQKTIKGILHEYLFREK